MPIYQYQDAETGQVIDVIRSVDERDAPVIDRATGRALRRIAVPARLQIVGVTPIPTTANKVLAGYHRQECKHGSRFKSAFTAAEVKRAWAQPVPGEHSNN